MARGNRGGQRPAFGTAARKAQDRAAFIASGGIVKQLNPALPLISKMMGAIDSRTHQAVSEAFQRRYWYQGFYPNTIIKVCQGAVIYSTKEIAYGGLTTDQFILGTNSNDPRTLAQRVALAVAEGVHCISLLGCINDWTVDNGNGLSQAQSFNKSRANMVTICNAFHDAGIYVLLGNETPKGAYGGVGNPDLPLAKNIWNMLTNANKTVVHSSGYTNIIPWDTLTPLLQPGTDDAGDGTYQRKTNRFKDTIHESWLGQADIGFTGAGALLGCGRLSAVDQSKPYLGAGDTVGVATLNPVFASRTGASSAISANILAPGGGAPNRPDNYNIALTVQGTLAGTLDYGTDAYGDYMELKVTGTPDVNPSLVVQHVGISAANGLLMSEHARVRVIKNIGLVNVQPKCTNTTTLADPAINDAQAGAGRPAAFVADPNGNCTASSNYVPVDAAPRKIFSPQMTVGATKTASLVFNIDTVGNTPSGIDIELRIYYMLARAV